MKTILISAGILFFSLSSLAQADESSELFKAIKANDSLLFDIRFNTCDIRRFENLLSESFEFYHDKAGITNTKQAFIEGMRNNICKLAYKPRRALIEGSMQVFPLEKNGVLYGAIQTGKHSFYAIEKVKPERLTSVALFTHVWLLENGQWKLSKSLSYDHKDVD